MLPRRPRAAAAALVAACLASACGPSNEAPRPPDVLLISVDTLRADHLGCYGYARDTSPWIDGLAARGIVFEQAQSQATATLPSHASLFTSLYPPQLQLTRDDGVNTNQHVSTLRIADAATTLAELLSDAGYDTAAFTGGAMMAGRYGFDHGFDLYRAATTAAEDDASVRVAAVRSHLAERRRHGDDDPLFLFVHSFDVHDPYAAPKPHASFFSKGNAADFAKAHGCPPMAMYMRIKLPDPTPGELEEVRALYDNGIRHIDAQLARLEQVLRENGTWDRTLVILVADHGEEFQEHGNWGHGPSVHAELSHVPLVVRLPGDEHAGLRVSRPVPLVDVAPTVADVLGIAAAPAWEGRSLLPLVTGVGVVDDADERLLYTDIPNAELGLRGVRRGRWKLVDDPKNGLRRLYDVVEDPGERRDVAAAHPELVAELGAALDAWLAERMRGAGRYAAVPMDDPTQTLEHVEQLRQLGYLADPALAGRK